MEERTTLALGRSTLAAAVRPLPGDSCNPATWVASSDSRATLLVRDDQSQVGSDRGVLCTLRRWARREPPYVGQRTRRLRSLPTPFVACVTHPALREQARKGRPPPPAGLRYLRAPFAVTCVNLGFEIPTPVCPRLASDQVSCIPPWLVSARSEEEGESDNRRWSVRTSDAAADRGWLSTLAAREF